MTREEAIEYWEGLRKTFSGQLEQEENYFGRMHLQTTIDAIDMAISALRQQEHFREVTKKVKPMTNADCIRAMTDEELLGFLMQVQDATINRFAKFELPNYNALADWLQMPAGEEDKHENLD